MAAGFALAATITILLVIPPTGTQGRSGWTQAEGGPLGPADRDLLAKVRQAGLWEIPTGQQAQQRASSEKVKDVGMHLVEDHTKLDKVTRELAARLDVVLPSQPNADQQGWMAQLSAVTGTAYDRDFANFLRLAHGKVFTAIAAVRAGTRNDEMRRFATQANAVVLKHMTLLESTGLVDFDSLPEPPTPSPVPVAAEPRRENP
ncbi:DUF4142 domain-containing protein [Nonomuraea sp. NPDC050556]|uniref:DUF4142 domain-containing protein n=1 Tax=Nonomuraea sp. NPDC050556 TaxID=3364369 RepID=UPI0037BDEF5A